MSDRREEIILQLGVISKSLLDNPDFAYRNADEVPESNRPAIVVMDADEHVDEKLDPYGKGRLNNKTIPVAMAPEIFVLLQDTDDQIGPQVNVWRAKVIKAIMTDAVLTLLCHEIRYEGFTSSLANGRAMEGQAKLHFTFVYMLRPDQL